jgi:hypothetical protein
MGRSENTMAKKRVKMDGLKNKWQNILHKMRINRYSCLTFHYTCKSSRFC